MKSNDYFILGELTYASTQFIPLYNICVPSLLLNNQKIPGFQYKVVSFF